MGLDLTAGMPRPLPIPKALTNGPFTTQFARTLGISEKVLRGRRFIRLFPSVWALASYLMTDLDWIRAAELTLPSHAQVSHLTRLRKLGLSYGPARSLQFTIQGELHLDTDGINLHRTKVLPPTDANGLTPAAAFIGYAASARVIDLIKVGDWLIHRGHMTMGELLATASRDRWRPGASAALWTARHLDGRSRSLKESETRAVLVFGGLPIPEVNADITHDGLVIACVDLLYRAWRLAVEYEGRQHALDPAQFNKDIGRYAAIRDEHHEYVQITNEMLNQSRAVVLRIHTKLVERGYDGPAPVFAARWRSLFEPVPIRSHLHR